jgi:hypothetical protein
MNSEKILQGIPRVYYGAFGGITPFPVCLKSVSDYLGDTLDYAYAIVSSGAAFRLVWNTTEWNGGNVDIMLTYKDPEAPFRNGITALGREFKMLWRAEVGINPGKGTRENFKTFIKEQIDKGMPVISLGPIGPPEAGIITGYRDNGETLLGWSLFQWDGQEAYFATDKGWDEGDFWGVMALGDICAPRFDIKQIVTNAIAALDGRQEGKYAKGICAYDAWKNALLNAKEEDFAIMPDWGQSIAIMCQGDATDCLIDGRKNAHLFFKNCAEENPGQPLYAAIAEQFGMVATVIHTKIYDTLGGYERGPKQQEALSQIENRQKIAGFIDEMKAADEKALALMKALL